MMPERSSSVSGWAAVRWPSQVAVVLRQAAVLVGAWWLAACSGEVSPGGYMPEEPVQAGSPTAGAGASDDRSDGGEDGSAAKGGRCGRTEAPPRAIGFEPRQYRNVLRDVVGYDGEHADEALPLGLETDLNVLDRPWVTTAMLDRIMREAEAAAESLRGQTAAHFGCPDLGDDACVRGALVRLARRAFGRPPQATEVDGLMAVRAEALELLPDDGGESAALFAIQALLAAPSTLYRTEFTEAPAGSVQTLSAHERAAAIAAFLLDSVPDQALLAAADDGSLLTAAGLRAQIERLLDLPRVQRHLTALVLNGYRVTRVFESPKDDVLFPELTPELQRSMFEESRRFVEDVLWTRAAPVSELMLGKTSFINDDLARLYDMPAPVGGDADLVETALPPGRSGLLTHASVLSGLARTDETSVVARGLYVRRDLLCLPKVPAPPDSVQTDVSAQLGQDASEVELAAYRAETQPCNGCHQQFDRFGLALEGFDPIGRARSPGPEPIDLAGLGPLTGVVQEIEDLVDVLVEDDRFSHCFAERLMDYALTTAGAGDAFCETDALHAALSESDGSLAAVVEAIVTHPAFITRIRESQP